MPSSPRQRRLPRRLLLPCGGCSLVMSVLTIMAANSLASQVPSITPTATGQREQAHAVIPLDHARELLNTEHWQDAAPVVKAYFVAHPDSGEAHALMGLILYREHQPRASMAEYLQASQSTDLSAFDLRIFAMDCAAIPDFPEAEKWLLRSLEKDNRDAATWEALGHVRFSSQHYEEAIDALQHTLQLTPRMVSAETLIGLANERLARLDVAETAYRTAIQWQTDGKGQDAVPFIALGRVLLVNNQPADAISWLQQAEKIAPTSSEAHEQLGLAFAKTGHTPEAAQELETAIRLQPDSARLHLMLARTYRSLGEKEKADREFEQYAKLNGSNPQ